MAVWRWSVPLVLIACGGRSDDPTGGVDNQPPDTTDDRVITRVGTPLNLRPLANDSDPDGDPLEITALGAPADGEATTDDGSLVTYTPDAGFTGSDTFTYTASDGQGGEAQGTVIVDVLPLPTLALVSPTQGAEIAAGTFTVEVAVDGCTLGGTGPQGCQITGSLDGSPIPAQTTPTFQVQSTDNGPHLLALSLVQASGSPFEPPIDLDVTWTTTGGVDTGLLAGSLTVTDVSQMVDFCADGFDSVSGDVVIASPTVLDTAPLTCLERIGGSLVLDGTAVQSLSLPALREIGQEMIVVGQPDLATASLPALESVGRDAIFFDNDALASIELSSLAAVGGRLRVVQTGALTALDLGAIATIGGSFELEDNPGPADLSLPLLTSVTGTFRATDNTGLETVDAPRLETVGAELRLQGLTLVSAEFDALTSIGTNLALPVTDLTTFEAPSLDTIGGRLQLETIDGLVTLELPELDAIGGDIIVDDNDQLAGLSLPELDQVGGRITITSLEGPAVISMPAITGAVTELRVTDNPGLLELEVGGSEVGRLQFEDNDAVTSLSLPELQTVADRLDVRFNGELLTFSAPRLVDVMAALDVSFNAKLASIELPSLQSVADLDIVDNALTVLDLSTLQTADGVDIRQGDGLTTVDLRSVRTVTNALALRVDALTSVRFDQLQSANDLTILGATALTLLSLQEFEETVLVNPATSLTTLLAPSMVSGSIQLVQPEVLEILDVSRIVDGELGLFGAPLLDEIALPSMTGGSLELRDTGVTSLALSNVDGLALTLRDNPDLATLDVTGSSVGSVWLEANPSLVRASLLVDEAGTIEVTDHDQLDQLDIGVVGSVEELSVLRNPTLAQLDLSGIDRVTGTFDALEIADNTALEQLDLSALLRSGEVQILGNPSLVDLDLGELRLLDRGLSVGGSPLLATLDLPFLRESTSAEITVDLDGISVLDLPNLELSGGLFARGAQLTSVTLPRLQTLTARLTLVQSPLLTTLDAPQLASCERLTVDEVGLNALSLPLLDVTGELFVTDNPALVSFALPSVTNPKAVVIRNNAVLTGFDLTATTEVTRIFANPSTTGELTILDNPSLQDLLGLAALREVGGSLRVDTNAALVDLDGLEMLDDIDGALRIEGNGSLVDIDALFVSLQSVGDGFFVIDNPLLPTADAEALADGIFLFGMRDILGNG